MSFQWKERYAIGIETIDSQHKRLFEIGAKAYELGLLNDGYDHYDEIVVLLRELKDYTDYHFSYEEQLMQELGYSDIEAHKQQHGICIERITALCEKDIDQDQQAAILEVMDFLSEWISSHIMLTDKKYTAFFKEKGVS